MELAAHWHKGQNLQKMSEYFLQQYTGGEMILSSKDWRTLSPSFCQACFAAATKNDLGLLHQSGEVVRQ